MDKLTNSTETLRRRDFMLEAIHQLGHKALELIAEGEVMLSLKADGTKVTSVDQKLNDLFITMATKEFSDEVWGEEGVTSERNDLGAVNNKWLWLVDPIDGTSGWWKRYEADRQFADCTSSIMVTGFAPGETTPTLSAICNPFNEESLLAYATPEGTFVSKANGPTRQVTAPFRAPRQLEQVKTYEYNHWKDDESDLIRMREIMPGASKIRTSSLGVVAANVVTGGIDIAGFPAPSNPHDVAPAALIVHRAGGTVTDLDGKPYEEIDWRIGPLRGCVLSPNAELAGKLVTAFALNTAR